MQRNVKSKLCTNPLHVRVWSKQNQKYRKIPKNQAYSISTDPISKLSNKNSLKNPNFTVKKSNKVAIKTASVLSKTCDFEDLTVRYINLSLTHLSFNLHVLAYGCMYIYLLFVYIYVNVLLWRFYFWKNETLRVNFWWVGSWCRKKKLSLSLCFSQNLSQGKRNFGQRMVNWFL